MPDFKPDARPPGQPARPARPRRKRPSVFAYSLWVHCSDAFRSTTTEPPPTVEVPTRQWMAAVGRRTLTPAELAARRAYFDQQIAHCLAHIP